MPDDPRIEELRRSEAAMRDELVAHGVRVRGRNEVLCPFHDDRHASAGWYTAKDGVVRFKCQRCEVCEDIWGIRAKFSKRERAEVIREVLGRQNGGRAESRRDEKPGQLRARTFPSLEALVGTYAHVEATYCYDDPEDESKVDLIVIRWRERPDGPKRFCQAHHNGEGWVVKAPEKPWPLYNRQKLRDAGEVVFCEGEKCVEALARVGVVATTSPAGAGKAEHCDLRPLAGKHIVLWPDNDPPDEKGHRTGIAHMRDVQRRLEALRPAPRLSWLDPDGLNLPPKGDAADLVADAIAKCGSDAPSVVRDVLSTADPLGPCGELRELMDETIAGRRQCLDFPWSTLSEMSMALMPGTITLLCGAPGASKSFFVLDAMRHWVESGTKVAALMLEEHRAWHLNRVLAMLESNSGMLSPRWIAQHADEVRAAQARHQRMIDAIGGVMQGSPADRETSQDQVTEWCENAIHDGAEIVIVDPVTIATRKGQPWVADSEFMGRLTAAVSDTRSRLLLVTHPRTGGGTTTVAIDSVAGGTAYQRFAQTILWLSSPKSEEAVTVARSEQFGTTRDQAYPDRIVNILKARNGPGQGRLIAFGFSGSTLRFRELGCVCKARLA